MLYILNSLSFSSLPDKGVIKWKKITLNDAKKILKRYQTFVSAIGHETTSQLLSSLLNQDIPKNRIMVKINEGDKAIVFQLRQRLPEGKVITSLQEIQEIGYDIYYVQIVRGK